MQTHTYNDFDDFAGAVRGIDSTMLLQNPTRRSWCISHVYLPGIHVQTGQLGSGNIVEGQSWSNGYLIYRPLTPECAYSANGIIIEKDSFVIMEPECEFCVSTKAEHDWYTVFVPAHKLAHGGDSMESSSGVKKTRCRVTGAKPQIVIPFWACISQIMIAAAKCLQFESTPAAACAEAELLKLASWVVGEPQTAEPHLDGRPRLSRAEIIRRCRELLEERGGKTVLVGELAVAAEVSERTLRTAFNEFFGIGPTCYLQLRQLHQVHRALQAAEPEAVSVTDIFLQNGVWAFGRFAARYRQLFGELPSETLRAQRRYRAIRGVPRQL